MFNFSLPSLNTTQTIIALVLIVWMIVESVWDLRDQNIPIFFSLVPLIAGAAYLWYTGQVAVAISIVLLVAATNLPPTARLISVVILALISFANIPPAYYPLLAGFLIVFAFFHLNIMGGADALAAVYALVWFPYWSMLAALMAGMLIAAIVIIAIKYRRNTAKHLIETISKNQSGTRAPTLTGFLLGVFAFTVAAYWPFLSGIH
jgi:Flp pilus assembly protein protease CpaA